MNRFTTWSIVVGAANVAGGSMVCGAELCEPWVCGPCAGACCCVAGSGEGCCEGCAVCVVCGAAGCADACESAACCAAALNDASRAAVTNHFEVRMTLLSKFFTTQFSFTTTACLQADSLRQNSVRHLEDDVDDCRRIHRLPGPQRRLEPHLLRGRLGSFIQPMSHASHDPIDLQRAIGEESDLEQHFAFELQIAG